MTTTGRLYVLSAAIALAAMVSRMGWINQTNFVEWINWVGIMRWIDWVSLMSALLTMLGIASIAVALALLIGLPLLLLVGIVRAVLRLFPDNGPGGVRA